MQLRRRTRFNTRAVHAGQEFEPRTGAVVPPVHLPSTYAQEAIGVLRAGYEYGRGTNPTRDSLQEQLAALEGGTARSPSLRPRRRGLHDPRACPPR